MANHPPKYYARMICDYLKSQSDQYADDPKDVQKTLNLSDEEFKLGLDWCIERKIIVMEKADAAAKKQTSEEKAVAVQPTETNAKTQTSEEKTVPAQPIEVVAKKQTSEEWTIEAEPEPEVAAAAV